MTTLTGKIPHISLTGPTEPGGVYLLWIQLSQTHSVSFGRFQQGKRIQLPAGHYVYIGSAHGQRGASSLGYRLLRHASRSAGPPHPIRPLLLKRLQERGLPAKTPTQKSLHWHIDYLLELPDAQLTDVAARMTNQKLEAVLADVLADFPETVILAPGLGASDHARGTHLMQVAADTEWWEALIAKFGDDVNLFL
ncbi:GIY-YIG nuclease family protein [bacterium]|nr:GIY-YIG nuclease family protein [bacterium]MCB2179182.1 GIY-YIG nuclease family protein [bacterium]